MSNSGNELLRQALAKYASSGMTAKTEDNELSVEGSTSGGNQSRSRRQSPASSRQPSRVASRAVSRNQSRIQSRSNSKDKEEKDDGLDEDELVQAADKLSVHEGAEPDVGGDHMGQFSSEQLSSALSALLDKVSEKRTTEEGLQGICSIMAHKYIGEFELRNRESYLDAFKRSLRNYKSLKEGLLASRGIALWFLQFGENDDSAYSDIYPFLKKVISDTNTSSITAQIIHTLAFANFIACEDYRDSVDIIDLCSKQLSDWKSAELTLMALNSYGLMMTVLGGSNIDLAKQIFERDYNYHYELLDCDDVDVRIASSENIALMYELSTEENDDSTNQEDDNENFNYNVAGLDFLDHDELLDKLDDMSKDSTKKHSKKDKQHQKQALRLVVASIESNINPSFKMNFRNIIVRFSTWTKITRLNAFKLTCSNGLYMQFVENPIMPLVFGSSIDSIVGNNLNGLRNGKAEERVVVDSKSEMAKYRSKSLNKLRSNKNMVPDDDF
ncbi:Interferon-related developmental regulator 1 [Smittium mucronatum]|uniref:Interferon-related developmental regulator 1 n=1 Tax=Smittium mucronatum TaxID=133383 RepID=A0A1R0H3G9_9FUNG|nr:Interferon-related developmental regulator 1 [Smittium mucronatum]